LSAEAGAEARRTIGLNKSKAGGSDEQS
jgi:hypothetical protein